MHLSLSRSESYCSDHPLPLILCMYVPALVFFTTAFDQEQQQKTGIILKLNEKPSLEIRSHIRSHSLKWNHLRNEWYGYVLDLQALKDGLENLKFELHVIKK
ncbi:MAG: hypothetical protein ACEY3C_06635 [Candidatus Tisiphia sp.]